MSETRLQHITAKHTPLTKGSNGHCLYTSTCVKRRLPLRHDHLEAVVMRFPGEQRVCQNQSFLQMKHDNDIVAAAVSWN